MKTFLSLFLSLVALNCAAQTQGGQYFHVPAKRPIISIEPSEKYIAIGDLAKTASFCQDSDPRHCFSLGEIEFAVPKNLNTLKTWTHRGQTFRVIQKLSTRGDYPAWVIQKTTGKQWWYLWSAHRGLVMFGQGAKSNQGGGYLLDGNCGFAADKACSP